MRFGMLTTNPIIDCALLAWFLAQLIKVVLEAVLALPEDYKTAVYLYYYEGYSAKEVASILRCPQATVRTRLARARKQLKQILGGDLDEE